MPAILPWIKKLMTAALPWIKKTVAAMISSSKKSVKMTPEKVLAIAVIVVLLIPWFWH